jgi:predicted O-methyltransferase YrrM
MTRWDPAKGRHATHKLLRDTPFPLGPPARHPQEDAIDVDPSARAADLASGPVDPVVLHTMSWSTEFAVACVEPATGSSLRRLAGTGGVRNVVEIGTGLGVSGLWLLQGLAPDAVLTTIDAESDHHAMARQSFAAAGFAPPRTRLITGHARQILPRLADAAYDLVFVDVDELDYPMCTVAAHRILRVGGLLVLHRPGPDVRLSTPEWTGATIGPDLLCATKT